MSIDLKQYEELKQKVDQLKSEADRAEGALQQLMHRMREEFGCETIDDAEKMLAKLRKEERAVMQKYEAERAKFEDDWKDALEEREDNGLQPK